MLEIGSVIDGKYKILNKIGQGGMSVVYLAMNERVNRQWAIKEVRREGIRDFEVVKQGIAAEIRILKKLHHSHLPGIIDIIDGDDSFLIVMDYIEGITLNKELEENGVQPQALVIDWAIQLCDVLGYLHSRTPPIIYRDMKPSNIMKKPDGNLILIDFGTAREFKGNVNQDTVILGTRGYAAPEQYGSRGETDARTDIYCLGATLYHLVTGHNPGAPPYRIYPIRYWNAALSSGFEKILLKCTRQNPEERYQSCTELMYDLQHYKDIDDTYIAGMKRKLKSFIIMGTFTVIWSVCAMGFHMASVAERQNTYDYYMENAELSKDLIQKEEYYKQAIEVDASQADAYLELLFDVYLSDNEYEYSAPPDAVNPYKTETQIMDELIVGFNGSDYDLAEIEYKVGIAVYYYADGIGNKQGAYKYFKDVTGEDGEGMFDPSDPSSAQKLKRAKCLMNISGYYSNLYIQDKSGDNVISFEAYWTDMKEIIKGNIVEEDNYKTALVVYKEFVTAIRDQVLNFKQANVSEDDLLAQLENIEQHLTKDFNEFIGGDNMAVPMVQEEIVEGIEQINNIITKAREQIELAYSM